MSYKSVPSVIARMINIDTYRIYRDPYERARTMTSARLMTSQLTYVTTFYAANGVTTQDRTCDVARNATRYVITLTMI